MLWTMAWRNLSRNPRRSIVTILAIALGVASITLFGGYVTSAFWGLKEQAIHGEKLGHLTIAKPGYFELGEIEQENFIFSRQEFETIERVLGADPDVTLISPRLSMRGLASNTQVSTIYIGDAIVREHLPIIRGDYDIAYDQSTGALDTGSPIGIALAENLARALKLEKGDPGVVFGSTLAGRANAVDFDVVDIYNTGNPATNDKFVLMPFELGQMLLGTDGAERVTVMLSDDNLTEPKRASIRAALNAEGIETEIRSWSDLSSFYKQVVEFLTLIFTFIFAIVVVVALMSIVNTMTMIVNERTKEIGTLRALGMQQGRTVSLFAAEGLLLALVGIALGIALLFIVGGAVNAAELTYVPPNSSSSVPLEVEFPPLLIIGTALALAAAAVAASCIPARRLSRTEIATALTHA